MVDIYRLGSRYIAADEGLDAAEIDAGADHQGRYEDHDVDEFSSDIQVLERDGEELHWSLTDEKTVRENLGDEWNGR